MNRPPVHPIESESYRILHERVDLSHLSPAVAAVTARVVHASADLEFAQLMVLDDASVSAGVGAVLAGAPVVCDVQMVRSGITSVTTACLLDEAVPGPGGYPTRSADAIARAARRWPDGAVFVIGCAPTALFEVVRLVEAGALRPALVIGMPVGFVGAAESKEALRRMAAEPRQGRPVPAISNRGEKGGSAVASAAFNALVQLAGATKPGPHGTPRAGKT
ncbi:MAG: precorrin-8X methylmutase [Acidimicrobiales bacterium]